MRTFDLVIQGATIVNVDRRQNANIYVKDGRIAHIGYLSDATASRTISADGLCALPGAVDSHVHFMDPAETDREDFITGSAAAAVGGVTTVIEHTHADPIVDVDGLDKKRRHLKDRSYVDFALTAHVWPGKMEQLPGLWKAGIAAFKIFTCTTHGVPGFTNGMLLEAFQAAAALDSPIQIHCEDETITEANLSRLEAQGEREGDAIYVWRSREAELAAINTVGLLSRLTGARVIVAHASHGAAVDLAADHRAKGADLWIETCPQYLYLDQDEIRTEGAYRKFTPPARARSRWEKEEMWRRVAFGPVTHVSSDHAPSTAAHKDEGVWRAHFGLPGVETTLPLLLDAVAKGLLSLERLVELTSWRQARLFGLYPRKGAIKVGADADIVLVDPDATYELTDEAIVSKSGWTPYAGRRVTGRVVQTYVRGALAAEDGAPVGEPGRGQFVAGPGARQPFVAAATAAVAAASASSAVAAAAVAGRDGGGEEGS